MRVVILFLIFWPSLAFAGPVRKVTLVSVNGTRAASDEVVMSAWKSTKKEFADIGLKLILREYLRIDDLTPTYVNLDTRKLRLYEYDVWARANGFHRGDGLTLFVVPQIEDNGALWSTGIARRVCAHNGLSTAWATLGENVMSVSIHAMIHELGHLLGANHDDRMGPYVMHADALSYVPESGFLEFSKRNKREIRRCHR